MHCPFWVMLVLWLQPATVCAQVEMSRFNAVGRGGVSATFVTDYQAIGINPANLGMEKSFRDPVVTFGFLEGGGTFYTQGFTFYELFQLRGKAFQFNDKQLAVERLAEKEYMGNADLMHVGFSFRLPKHKIGFAFGLQDNFKFYGMLNRNAAELIFLGKNASFFNMLELADGRVIENPYPELPTEAVVRGLASVPATYSSFFEGTRISASWLRAYNFSMGMQLLETYRVQLSLGVGVKLLQGMALVDMRAEDGQLAQSNLSLSPSLGISLGDSLEAFNPSFVGVQNGRNFLSQLAFPQPVGHGFGFDLGIHLTFSQNLHVAASLTNLGSINWRGNAYSLPDLPISQFGGTGFNSFNVLNFTPETFSLGGEESPVKWEGTERLQAAIPGLWRLGVSYDLQKLVHFGVEVLAPANRVAGNIDRPILALGSDFWLNRVFKFSTGFNTGGGRTARLNWSAGMVYQAYRRNFEMGVAFRDLASYFNTGLGEGSTASLSMGFMRFKI